MPLFHEKRLDVPEPFAENVQFALDQRATDENEAFHTENFVHPFLRLAWKRHPRLHVWSHRPFPGDERLDDDPNYLVAATPVGVISRIVNPPLLAVVEVGRRECAENWSQCLAAMLACRRVNQRDGGPVDGTAPVYGVVSTGLTWEFGRLHGQRFTHHPDAYGVNDPALLFGVLDGLFEACGRQLPPA